MGLGFRGLGFRVYGQIKDHCSSTMGPTKANLKHGQAKCYNCVVLVLLLLRLPLLLMLLLCS